jgi:hypothetical protein
MYPDEKFYRVGIVSADMGLNHNFKDGDVGRIWNVLGGADTQVFSTKKHATEYALEMQTEENTEYGICSLIAPYTQGQLKSFGEYETDKEARSRQPQPYLTEGSFYDG